MGPFQDYEKSALKSPRSRIPRLVLHPYRPKDKNSPLSDSPYSEEEGKDSDHSKGTISTNSFYSDDTGCPTSKSTSPSKSPSGSDQSAHSSPVLSERPTKVKRVRVVAEGCGEQHPRTRQKRELQSAMKHKGSEADFSSSSSTGSLKAREIVSSNSVGKKAPTRRTTRIRPLPIFKPTGSPVANRDAELYAPYGTPPRVTTSANSSSNSSPMARRASLGRYHSCGDNHGIRPPNPEQYLTPLQQKEVTIRHLRTKLLESENRVQDRESEIEALKGQMSRMREDWIEEECHRVEAQLSLKEARKEIKQLRQVVETMKSSLMEKDKGIQKYFIDINIQNRKLESLLHSMELAQSGNSIDGEQTLAFIGDGSNGGGKKMLGEVDVEMEHGAEAMADSGLLVNDEMANRADILEQVFMSTAVDCSQDANGKLCVNGTMLTALSEVFPSEQSAVAVNTASTVTLSQIGPCQDDKEVQTDPVCSDIQTLLLQLLKFHGVTLDRPNLSTSEGLQEITTASQQLSNMPITDESPDTATDSGIGSAEPVESSKFMEELDFDSGSEEHRLTPGLEVMEKRYWSNNFLVDLVAVAAPVLPTVAWMYSRHGVDGRAPFYNIAALIRGCCIVGLHSLRHGANKPGT